MITLLGGGIGASRFSKALTASVPEEEITCIVNTADDFWHYGLRICPDLDATLYTHAGWRDGQRGWGLQGDSFRAMEQIRRLGELAWFNLGDLDLATHLLRTGWLREGQTLSQVVNRLAEAMEVHLRVLPMTEDEVETHVLTPKGWLSYQHFLVLNDAQDPVTGVCYRGGESAQSGHAVIAAIEQADLIILAPSNPFASIMPALSLPGVRGALRDATAPVLAITPIVSGIPITEPGEAKRARSRAALMAAHGLPHRAAAVAGLYKDIADVFVLDEVDREEAVEIEALGITVLLAPTLFHKTTSATATVERLLRYRSQQHRDDFSRHYTFKDLKDDLTSKEIKWSGEKNQTNRV
ncbi:MAG: 2-phospho-L-lactate transferase [Ktedonobacteraceae bacterium]